MAVYLVLLIINTLYPQLFVLIQNVQHATVLSGNKLKAKERELQSKRDQLDGTKKRVASLRQKSKLRARLSYPTGGSGTSTGGNCLSTYLFSPFSS